jgi:hypothetical protein
MSLVNSHPLSPYLYHDEDLLTPNHLILLCSDVVLPPPGKFEDVDLYSRKRWRRVQHLVNVFRTKWKALYLIQLQERGKWLQRHRNVAVGDIVLLKESSNRGDWRLGRVEETFPGPDDLVRRVRVKIQCGDSSTTLERPISKLVVLVESV